MEPAEGGSSRCATPYLPRTDRCGPRIAVALAEAGAAVRWNDRTVHLSAVASEA